MPLDPPVMTATLPSSVPMTCPFVVSDSEMGRAASAVECGSAHTGGAKSIRQDDAGRDDRCQPLVEVSQNVCDGVGSGMCALERHPNRTDIRTDFYTDY